MSKHRASSALSTFSTIDVEYSPGGPPRLPAASPVWGRERIPVDLAKKLLEISNPRSTAHHSRQHQPLAIRGPTQQYHTMRRIARLPQQPSAVLTKCLHSQPTQSARSKAAAATGCLASRPRAFTTTSARSEHPLRPWTANKAKPTEEIPSELATESLTTRQPKIQTSSPEVNGADYHDTAAAFINEDPFSFDSEEPQAIATDLILPPIERTTAPRADDLNEAEYEAAHNATGLPVVGGLAGWFSEAQNHWGPSKSFASFANEAKVTHPAQLELCARRAVLEALAVRSARVEALLVESWRADGGWESVMGLGLTIDGEGKATVEGDVKGVVAGLVGDVGARETMMSVDQAREIVKVTNTDWKRVSLKDAKLKFAVCSRRSPRLSTPSELSEV